MMVLTIGIELPNVMAFQRPHDADAGEKHPSVFPFGSVGQPK
jgi:hypothetical protein